MNGAQGAAQGAAQEGTSWHDAVTDEYQKLRSSNPLAPGNAEKHSDGSASGDEAKKYGLPSNLHAQAEAVDALTALSGLPPAAADLALPEAGCDQTATFERKEQGETSLGGGLQDRPAVAPARRPTDFRRLEAALTTLYQNVDLPPGQPGEPMLPANEAPPPQVGGPVRCHTLPTPAQRRALRCPAELSTRTLQHVRTPVSPAPPPRPHPIPNMPLHMPPLLSRPPARRVHASVALCSCIGLDGRWSGRPTRPRLPLRQYAARRRHRPPHHRSRSPLSPRGDRSRRTAIPGPSPNHSGE